MGKLTEYLTGPVHPPSPIRYSSRGEAELELAVQRVFQRWPDRISQIDSSDRQALLDAVAHFHKKQEWSDVTVSTVVSAARVAFDADYIERREYETLREFLIHEITLRKDDSYVRALLDVYLCSYNPAMEHTSELAEALLHNAKNNADGFWREYAKVIDQLFTSETHKSIARAVFDSNIPIEVLKQCGLNRFHDPGMMQFVHREVIDLYRPGLALADLDILEEFLGWLLQGDGNPRKGDDHYAISAMVEPWLHSDPDNEYRDMLLQRIISLYDDPRLFFGAPWNAVDQTVIDTVCRWLVGDTIVLFMDTISQSLKQDNYDSLRMWENRKPFWLGLHKQGKITAAWVAFSDQARMIARRAAKNDVERKSAELTARQVARGGRTKTSILILKIGSTIVVEGSHSYKVHVFFSDNRFTPALYESVYDCELLKDRSDRSRSHTNNWEEWVQRQVL